MRRAITLKSVDPWQEDIATKNYHQPTAKSDAKNSQAVIDTATHMGFIQAPQTVKAAISNKVIMNLRELCTTMSTNMEEIEVAQINYNRQAPDSAFQHLYETPLRRFKTRRAKFEIARNLIMTMYLVNLPAIPDHMSLQEPQMFSLRHQTNMEM